MSSKNTAEVILGGKVIKLGGYESEVQTLLEMSLLSYGA